MDLEKLSRTLGFIKTLNSTIQPDIWLPILREETHQNILQNIFMQWEIILKHGCTTVCLIYTHCP